MMLGRVIGVGAVVLGLGLMAVPAAQAAEITTPATVSAKAAAGVSTIEVSTTGDATYTISATGSAGYGYQGGTGPCAGYPTTEPDGSRYLGGTSCGGPKDDPNATLAGYPIGLLIGKVGNGAWFAVGADGSVPSGVSGMLTLAYNDSDYSDNSGSYSVTITEFVPPPCSGDCPLISAR
jgi:hypothetical protein